MTLVEVMVAMTVGIILLLAMGTLFANSTRVFKANDDFSRMQENGAYALNAIGATPMDLVSILQAMKSAGALRADLEVI